MIKNDQLEHLEQDLQPYKSLLSATSDTILDQEVSKYPIFVIHQQEINIGIPLDAQMIPGKWQVNVSSMEEFVTKQLIEGQKTDAFISIYKDPKLFLCLFVVKPEGASFVFIPRE